MELNRWIEYCSVWCAATQHFCLIQKALAEAVSTDRASGSIRFDAVKFNQVFHPMHVFKRIPLEAAQQVEVLPSIPFDPVWLTYDTKVKAHNLPQIHNIQKWVDFFSAPAPYIVSPALPTDVFKGALSHHWHNNWNVPFVKQSLFGQLVEAFDAFLGGDIPGRSGVHYTACNP